MIAGTSVEFRFSKISRIKDYRILMLYILLVITPLMDTINGWYVLGHGETGVSIGTFYRIAILLYIFFFFRFTKKGWLYLIIASYFPISSVIRAFISGFPFMSAFTYGLKWVLPIIYILLFEHLNNKSDLKILNRILDIWKYLIPLLLILEYIAGVGKEAYLDAGFKGYFYCTNDIGFSLTMMTIYSLYMFLIVEMNFRNLIPVIFNFAAILILSTKSCVIFTVITIVLFLMRKIKKRPEMLLPTIVGMMMVLGIVSYKLRDSLHSMLSRYIVFFQQTAGVEKSFSNIMGFLTSARTYRISGAIEELWNQFSLKKFLFGWNPPIFTGAIEMDWIDALFQHGLVGIAILMIIYYRWVINKKYKSPFQYMLIIAMICAFFSGHVLNGALPSTVFSIVVGAAICSVKGNKKK